MSTANELKAAARCPSFACTHSPGLGLGRVSPSTPQPRIQSEDVVLSLLVVKLKPPTVGSRGGKLNDENASANFLKTEL